MKNQEKYTKSDLEEAYGAGHYNGTIDSMGSNQTCSEGFNEWFNENFPKEVLEEVKKPMTIDDWGLIMLMSILRMMMEMHSTRTWLWMPLTSITWRRTIKNI